MTQQELQSKYDRLVDRVRRMRGHQKNYLKYYASDDKRAMKRLEYEVDNLLKDAVQVAKSRQPEIF